jgi:hypothetical protein
MTATEDPRKPTSHVPQSPPDAGPAAAAPPEPVTAAPPAAPASEPAPPPTGPGTPAPGNRAVEAEEPARRAGQKVTALLTGAAALANKVRSEAPKKIREAREKHAAGHCVILTEVDGRAVAVGPYRNDQAAHEDAARVGGAPRVVELLTRTTYFGTEDGGNGASARP